MAWFMRARQRTGIREAAIQGDYTLLLRDRTRLSLGRTLRGRFGKLVLGGSAVVVDSALAGRIHLHNPSFVMPKVVYLETSFFSFLYDERLAPAIAARRGWTEEWWTLHRGSYELMTSTAVIAELERGEMTHRQRALDLALTLPAVAMNDEAAEVVAVYVERRLMPKDPLGDALHLALASVHKCDFLLTWNCQNLANANKFGHIRRVNTLLGLQVPSLVTPLELMEDATDEDS